MRALTVALGFLTFTIAAAAAAILPNWFDYKDCDFCMQWGKYPDLIAHTRDECRNLSNGIVWITYVEKPYVEQFAKVQEEEAKIGELLEAGKPLNLCQYCSHISEFGSKGVQIEFVEGSDAFITLYTSSDTTIVTELHDFGARAVIEEAKANASFLSLAKATK